MWSGAHVFGGCFAGEFLEGHAESIAVVESTLMAQFLEADSAGCSLIDQGFTMLYPELVEVFIEVHAHFLVEVGRDLVQGNIEVGGEVLQFVVGVEEGFLLVHIRLHPVPDEIQRCLFGIRWVCLAVFVRQP